MSIHTNGTRVSYFDHEIGGFPIFCTLRGKIVAVTPTIEEAIEVVNQGIHGYVRFTQMNSVRVTAYGHVVQDIKEYKRKAAAKFPDAHVF